ncbi:hypothetical protein B0G57_10210 [Trinickia symbiotica]|uniref:hypothetical protein n=1 Tax=Trinickia symbiotica TaxID=863227 RepID=UPI00036FAB4B|nr:hypothetical protein [Trinickia symbiotica]PPK46415.1 hypothetical protein B0G57_10210 [Trinickia symbiotica]
MKAHYRLQADPRSGALLLPASTYNVPLATPEDYARIALYQPHENTPVLLDHAQYFRFLSALADAVWRSLGDKARLFIQLRAPFIDSLPANLLDARVVLGTGLANEMNFWTAAGPGPSLWITDRIRRDLDYPGDNTLTCAAPDARWLDAADAVLTRAWPGHAVRLVRVERIADPDDLPRSYDHAGRLHRHRRP